MCKDNKNFLPAMHVNINWIFYLNTDSFIIYLVSWLDGSEFDLKKTGHMAH